MKQQLRIGNGFDVHQFIEGRKLFLGGVEIPFHKGLLGHSDADVLLHAICDAMLGALALGDIGKHFPNDDPRFKDIDSKLLLRNVNVLINQHEYEVSNLDATLLLEKPKILPFVEKMTSVIANILTIEINQVSIKATTTEKLGFTGREEGAAAFASVLLAKRNS
ncbi:MAG: 2-C-methyl-D-erythritol 2,4-cyclodiphosphate synthase [Ignavibacteria bacterium CG_4_8_14_3_um_filter_37_9]|nr:MAG: 2-C-methyl-D-erythritol 2,4-cyclodiphosphate synthase [Ignavibacteria bacterium CG1_02_37_35]PIX00229.1 MAG: 2-C-methyl-D-erythritol 2,4-cyclodiphosphate synthase [Ignavibacteria bacterium CG_4_8_14_3_um_filter_37_9]PIX93411.1 MAG: 2-C-methyl-D-erythritol 2,4-cyclodiphosphate synthase [Ignavibacteria bacterium CG_4_10_14_3_um_filter_37_18]PJC60176.1 MAG: 2-C-methyl-D-erythritol 2,4-cyclodiphosphate synthase [Ignavibacteria bacterium CG_4_9_14_0_2_um_filter_37_13]